MLLSLTLVWFFVLFISSVYFVVFVCLTTGVFIIILLSPFFSSGNFFFSFLNGSGIDTSNFRRRGWFGNSWLVRTADYFFL